MSLTIFERRLNFMHFAQLAQWLVEVRLHHHPASGSSTAIVTWSEILVKSLGGKEECEAAYEHFMSKGKHQGLKATCCGKGAKVSSVKIRPNFV